MYVDRLEILAVDLKTITQVEPRRDEWSVLDKSDKEMAIFLKEDKNLDVFGHSKVHFGHCGQSSAGYLIKDHLKQMQVHLFL